MGEKKMSMQEMEKLAVVRKKVGVEKEKEKEKGKEVVVEGTNRKKAMVGAGKEGIVYPAPLYSHEQVVRSSADIFLWTLKYFHFFMCTKFKIPVIGGKRLDLRHLYVEVTQRGGAEQVAREKRWGEVGATFKFPSTATNASFVLRKYYLVLLFHFEQVYFFRIQGPPVSLPESLQIKRHISKPGSSLKISDSTIQWPENRKRAPPTSQNDGTNNFTFTGTIHTKFEYGYVATVKIGSETMCGVFYNNVKQLEGTPSSSTAEAPSCETASQAASTGMRSKQNGGQRHHDSMHPKKNKSAYNFFYAEKRNKLKALFPHRVGEHSNIIRELWNKLTKEEQSVYKDLELKDKERYKGEMEEYKERLRQVRPKEVVMAKTANTKVVACK